MNAHTHITIRKISTVIMVCSCVSLTFTYFGYDYRVFILKDVLLVAIIIALISNFIVSDHFDRMGTDLAKKMRGEFLKISGRMSVAKQNDGTADNQLKSLIKDMHQPRCN